MKRDLCFTIVALFGSLASGAMALDNNWSGAAFGFVAAVASYTLPYTDLTRLSKILDGISAHHGLF
jgi:hypothetical protein